MPFRSTAWTFRPHCTGSQVSSRVPSAGSAAPPASPHPSWPKRPQGTERLPAPPTADGEPCVANRAGPARGVGGCSRVGALSGLPVRRGMGARRRGSAQLHESGDGARLVGRLHRNRARMVSGLRPRGLALGGASAVVRAAVVHDELGVRDLAINHELNLGEKVAAARAPLRNRRVVLLASLLGGRCPPSAVA